MQQDHIMQQLEKINIHSFCRYRRASNGRPHQEESSLRAPKNDISLGTHEVTCHLTTVLSIISFSRFSLF